MNTFQNPELLISLTAVIVSITGSYLIMRTNWKKYGLLYVLSAVIFSILCYLFVRLEFYSFPVRMFPFLSTMPLEINFTVFPFLVLFGIRYSPAQWGHKISFYWVIVHLGMLVETLLKINTSLVKYDFAWDFWDSYTWWWIYLLLLEWMGGLVVPAKSRKPISSESFKSGRWAWIVIHFILIITVFLGGFYLGQISISAK